MRAQLLSLPIALAAVAALPAAAQDAPRVLFCSGQCFAVDAKGARTPAPKGTELLPGQRLETGPGAYAQVKLGAEAAVGISERAQVRFDSTSVRDRNVVVLDQGRIRAVDGAAIGKPSTRPIELRTSDGTFVLRSADAEVRKTVGPASAPVVMKINAGDARLLSRTGDIAVPKEGVQGIRAGAVLTGNAPISLSEVALPTTRGGAAPSAALTPAPIAALPVTRIDSISPPALREPTVLVRAPLTPTTTPTKSVVTVGDVIPTAPLATPTGETTTLTKLVTEPLTTSLSTSLSTPTTTTTTTTTTTCTTCTATKLLDTSTIQLAPTTTTTTLAPTTTLTSTKLLIR